MAQTQANVAALFKQTYREAIPMLFEVEQDFCSNVQARADLEKAGPATLIIPKKMTNGGQFRTFSPDGGDMGRGSGATYAQASMTPLPVLIALELNKSVKWNTANDSIAVHNAAKDLLTDGMEEFKAHLDRHLMTSGNGVLAQSASAVSTLVTMTAPVGSRLLRPGSAYSVYDSTLATNRGTAVCLSVDYPNRKATFDSMPGGYTAGSDYFLPDGITGATPTWIYGLKYWHSSAATGYFNGLDRATYPQLRTPQVAAASAALATSHIRLAKSKIELLRGGKVWSTGKWQWFMSPAQRQAYEELGLQYSKFERGAEHQGLEAMFNVGKITIDGTDVMVSVNADPSRVDLIDWSNIFKGETLPVGLYDVDGLSTFPVYGASGGLAAAEILYLANIAQYSIDDPQRGVYIDGLSYATGY